MNANLIIYTQTDAIKFDIVNVTEDFADQFAESIERGSVQLDTADGTTLIVNRLNTVAFEVILGDEIPPRS